MSQRVHEIRGKSDSTPRTLIQPNSHKGMKDRTSVSKREKAMNIPNSFHTIWEGTKSLTAVIAGSNTSWSSVEQCTTKELCNGSCSIYNRIDWVVSLSGKARIWRRKDNWEWISSRDMVTALSSSDLVGIINSKPNLWIHREKALNNGRRIGGVVNQIWD